MNSSYGILLAIYAAGAVVGLVCWLPYYLSTRRWARELQREHRDQYDSTVAVHGRLVEEKNQVASVQGQLSVKTAEAARIQNERNDLSRRAADLEANVETLEGSARELADEIRELKRSLAEADEEIEVCRNQIALLESDLGRRKAEWDAAKRQLERELATMQANADELRTRLAELQASSDRRSNDSIAERNRLEASLGHANRIEFELRQQFADLKAAQSRTAAEWQSERDELQRQLLDATTRCERLTAGVAERETQVDALTRERDEVSRQFVRLTAQIATLKQTEANLQGEVDRHSAESQALAAANRQLEEGAVSLSRQIVDLKNRVSLPADGQKRVVIPGGSPRITIGLDFGSHSTKVVFRARGHTNKSWVVRFDTPATGYPTFAAPSLVRMDEGRLYFGSAALGQGEGKLFRSLKRELLPIAGDDRPARNDDGGLASVLTAIYLAWVLRMVAGILGVDADKISLNVGVPMNRQNEKAIYDRFMHVVHAAWELAFGDKRPTIEQGVGFDDLSSQVRELLDKPVPDDRRFEIAPESLCPVVSLGLEPAIVAGAIMVIDMGARATEVSVSSRSSFEDGESPIRCLWDESFALGGNLFHDIDNADISLELHRERESALVRQFLEKLDSARQAGLARRSPKAPYENGFTQPLRILKIGGGLRRRQIEKALDELYDPSHSKSAIRSQHSNGIDWYAPVDLSFWDQNAQEPPALFSFLAVAHGLSVHREQWPKLDSLDEIEDVRSNQQGTEELVLASHNRR